MPSTTHPPSDQEDVDRGPARAERLNAEAAEPTLDGAFAADGVDLTVIRWMLERSPEERLEAAQQLIDATWSLRRRDQA